MRDGSQLHRKGNEGRMRTAAASVVWHLMERGIQA